MIRTRPLVLAVVALAAASAVISPTHATVEEAGECRLTFLEGTITASSDDEKCALLQEYNTCLSNAFANGDVSESEQAPFWNSLALYASSINTPCTSTDTPNPELLASAHGFDFSVGADQDISFTRLRRDTVSLTEIADDIAAIEAALEEAPSRSDVRAATSTAATIASMRDVEEAVLASGDAYSAAFSASSAQSLRSVLARVESLEQEFTRYASNDDFNARISKADDRVSAFTSISDELLSEQQSTLDSTMASLNSQLSELTSTVTAAQDSLAVARNTTNTTLLGALAELESSVDTMQSTVRAEWDATTSTIEAYNARVTAVTSTIQDKVVPARIAARHIVWSGYCSNHGTANGWQAYCTNVVEFNTAGDYFENIDTGNGRFRMKEPGLLRVSAFAISLSGSWAHTRLLVNGNTIQMGHEHSHGTWTDNFVDVTWNLSAGDVIEVQFYRTGGSYTYHSGNAYGAHSRLQLMFLGTI